MTTFKKGDRVKLSPAGVSNSRNHKGSGAAHRLGTIICESRKYANCWVVQWDGLSQRQPPLAARFIQAADAEAIKETTTDNNFDS